MCKTMEAKCPVCGRVYQYNTVEGPLSLSCPHLVSVRYDEDRNLEYAQFRVENVVVKATEVQDAG